MNPADGTKKLPLLLLLFMIVLFPIMHTQLLMSSHDHMRNSFILSQDTIRPEIHSWGIDGVVSTDSSFIVWANTTDAVSGILNVSTVIRLDGNSSLTTWTLMPFNGTCYAQTFSPLAVNHTYSIWIEVYDNAYNRAQSYSRSFDLNVYPPTGIDPNVTLPYVLVGSLFTFIAAVLAAKEYQRRNPRSDSLLSMSHTEEEMTATNGETS